MTLYSALTRPMKLLKNHKNRKNHDRKFSVVIFVIFEQLIARVRAESSVISVEIVLKFIHSMWPVYFCRSYEIDKTYTLIPN